MGDSPQKWLTTILVGILKQGKVGTNPDSYRLVGLECCLLKMLTLLIDKRLQEWAEFKHLIPNSQNGFRKFYRTNNNPFILRCAIEKAWSQGKPLYVAFVNLKNAFPSTDLPTLWAKLYRSGVSGPLFDWLRMIYSRMLYIVKHGGSYSTAFKSMIGVLTGDSASPGLWNIYFGDLPRWFPADNDDIVLSGIAMSHIKQADDVALFSTTAAGLQRRLNSFTSWCSANSMVISVEKTQWMVFGPFPRTTPSIYVNGNAIALVDKYKFVGIWFTSVKRHLFEKHYTVKASKAQGIAHASFTVDSMIGTLPPREGIRLYMARVDPHLISACEVVLDVTPSLVAKLEKPQLRFLRRLLGLKPRSMRAILFTETGLLPIRYRRAIIALNHAKYWAQLEDDHFARAAYAESLRLSSMRCVSWASDLRAVLASLPIPVTCTEASLESAEGIDDIISAVESSCEAMLQGELDSAVRTAFLRQRLETDEKGQLRTVVLRFRQYLDIVNVGHRKAFTRFLLSDHNLGVEALRPTDRDRKYPIPRAWPLCRFCQLDIEDETHAAMVCTAHPELTPLRAAFLRDIFAIQPSLQHSAHTQTAEEFLGRVLLDHAVTTRVARYVSNLLDLYALEAMWVLPRHFNLG